MATLTSTKIKDTYAGLIKTNNNTAISATNQYLTDGQGNVSPLSIGTSNIGIGTTSTSYKLDVSGTGRFTSTLNVGQKLTSNGDVTLSTAGGGADSGAKLTWDMSVYGGASNSHIASIKANSYATGVNQNALDFFVGDFNNNANVGTSKMRITSSGWVGIGTTSPTSKLQVTGLPSYADNATALAGGLTVGAFYHTAGVLKVVV